MNTTINISLPRSILQDAKKHMARLGFTSMSEFIRAAIRKEVYPETTENGFTPGFEAEVLKAAAEPKPKDKTWNTEEDITDYFKNLNRKFKKKNGKDQKTG